MSKLYGKMWSEGTPNHVSTRRGHNEITTQILYGSRYNSKIAIEVTVKVCPHGHFILTLDIPELFERHKYRLP